MSLLDWAGSLLDKATEDHRERVKLIRQGDPNKAKRTFERIRDIGMGESSKMAGHYLDTSPVMKQGMDCEYDLPRLRNANIVKDAEKTNQERLLNALSQPKLAKEKNDLARSYPVKASWKTYPLGVIKVNDDNTIDQSGVEWNFLDR